MGTRCLTEIYDDNKLIATVYRQFDGYPSGHLREMKEHYGDKKLVNGFSFDQDGKVFNGMGCYAASLIGHLKRPHKTGNIYLVPPVGDDENYKDRWEGYLYRLRDHHGEAVFVEVFELRKAKPPKLLYSGTLKNAPTDIHS